MPIPPSDDPELSVRSLGSPGDEHLRFVFYQDAVEELVFASEHPSAGTSAIAVLTGGFRIADEGGFVEVTGFSGFGRVETMEELYATTRQAADQYLRSEPELPMVGLWVARRGGGARVEEEMVRVHLSLFNIPFQPLVVYDPNVGKIGVYARVGGRFGNVGIDVVSRLTPARREPAPKGADVDSVGSDQEE